MTTRRIPGRQLKVRIRNLLLADDFQGALVEIMRLPARQAVNPLFGLLYDGRQLLRWRAVVTMGAVVAKLAETQIEAARVIMRRLMWNLNDESGGIGWGSPEAMGEIMARSQRLADEYHRILTSYVRPDGNFLEHEGLQRGVLWALGRLGRVRPTLVHKAAPHIAAFLHGDDSHLRGLAVWALIPLGPQGALTRLRQLTSDAAQVAIFEDGAMQQTSVAALAERALETGQRSAG
jgi:hypothetical protein